MSRFGTISRSLLKPGGDDSDEVARIIRGEEEKGLAFVFWGRTAVLLLIALWLALTLPVERSALYLTAITVFAALGTGSYLLSKTARGGDRTAAVFLAIDALALSYLFIVPTPYDIAGWTPQMNLRLPGFLYLGVFVVAMSLSYRPWLVVWGGCVTIVSWTVLYLWAANLPGSLTYTSTEILAPGRDSQTVLDLFLDPLAVPMTRLSNQILFLALVTLLSTVTVWRSRRLIRNRMIAETQKTALSRYFSPNMVKELVSQPSGLGETREQEVAVLYADMADFTRISENLAPGDLIEFLREFHKRLANVVFRHDGTVDKYIGDAIMVHFGTPLPRSDDPVRALACALHMLDEIRSWSRERVALGKAPISIRIGLHFGKVVIGNIGDDRRLEFAVLGDTVNVASRLEHHTREIGSPLIVSDDLMEAVKASGADPHDLAPHLKYAGRCTLRGRQRSTTVWSN